MLRMSVLRRLAPALARARANPSFTAPIVRFCTGKAEANPMQAGSANDKNMSETPPNETTAQASAQAVDETPQEEKVDEESEAKPANASTEEEAKEAAADENLNESSAAEESSEGAEPEEELPDPLADLQTDLTKSYERNAQLKSQLLRSLADMENVREVARRDVSNAFKYSSQKFAKELLEVSDNLQRACDSVPKEQLEKKSDANACALSSLYDGLMLTQKGLLHTYERHDIKKMDALGAKFDPNFHEALFEVPTENEEQVGLVSAVTTEGYMFKDRVLRSAKVGVFKKM